MMNIFLNFTMTAFNINNSVMKHSSSEKSKVSVPPIIPSSRILSVFPAIILFSSFSSFISLLSLLFSLSLLLISLLSLFFISLSLFSFSFSSFFSSSSFFSLFVSSLSFIICFLPLTLKTSLSPKINTLLLFSILKNSIIFFNCSWIFAPNTLYLFSSTSIIVG